MSRESDPSSEELKKYLKDASLYEENMDYEDMLNCYKVIKCSESTAQEEEEQRSFQENLQNDVDSSDTEKVYSTPEFNFDCDIKDDEVTPPRTTAKTTLKPSKLKLGMIKSSKTNSTSCKTGKVEYNVSESPLLKHKPLDIILYDRKYDIPPYCNPKLSKLTTLQRAKLILNFHRAILEKFYKLQCESLNPAPWGKPILSSDKFNGTLDRSSKIEDDDYHIANASNDDGNSSSQEIYTSRHGRQTKRKVYTDLDVDGDTKKSRKDDDKPFEIEKKPLIKRQSMSKLTNQDIMKRSKLFSEPMKTTRSEKLFDTMIKTNEKKSEEDKQCEKHESSSEELTLDNDIDVDIIPNSQESDVIELKPKEISFMSRNNKGPRGRRPISSRKLLYTDLTKTNGTPTSPTVSKINISTPTSSAATATTVTEKSPKPTPGKAKCPICSQIFFQDEIEAHASSCGLFTESESNFDVLLPSGNIRKIKCSVCDKEMIMNEDYEVHVKDCIQQAKENDKL